MNECKCELQNCSLCPNVALKKELCSKCNTGYYPKENDPLNIGKYKKCYNNPDGYYLDNNIYKQCYYTCKKCNISGTNEFHNCIECNDNFSIEIKYNNYINCYENCSYYHYIDDEYNYRCTLNLSCPKEYPELSKDKMECNKKNKNFIENLEINRTENMSKEEEIAYYDYLLKKIEEEFIDNYDISNLDNGEDEYITTEKMTWTFTTLENQRKNINNNMTTIDLGECEALLRAEYNISYNKTLYIKIIDIAQEETKASKVEYDVYCKLFGTNLIKLNLTVCSKSKISIYKLIELTDNLDKYNISSGFYNDICYTTTSEDGTDITLKDRQKNIIKEDKIVCQENCVFAEYNYTTSKAVCSCDVKEASSSFSDMKINKTKILDNFINIKNKFFEF